MVRWRKGYYRVYKSLGKEGGIEGKKNYLHCHRSENEDRFLIAFLGSLKYGVLVILDLLSTSIFTKC